MTDHKTATRAEWLAARLDLLEAEKALTRRSDEVARQRQALPWVRIDKAYHFEINDGSVRSIYWHCAMPTALSSQLAGWALSRQTSMVCRPPRGMSWGFVCGRSVRG